MRLAEIVFLVIALLVNPFDAFAVLIEDVADGSTALAVVGEAEVAPDGQVLVSPRRINAAYANVEFAVLDDSIDRLLVAFAIEGKAGRVDIVGYEVTFSLARVDIDATRLLAIVGSRLVLGSIEAAVHAVLCIDVAQFVGIDTEHRCSEVIHEELSRNDV